MQSIQMDPIGVILAVNLKIDGDGSEKRTLKYCPRFSECAEIDDVGFATNLNGQRITMDDAEESQVIPMTEREQLEEDDNLRNELLESYKNPLQALEGAAAFNKDDIDLNEVHHETLTELLK